MRLTGPRLGFELQTCGTLRASRSAAHGAHVIWPLDYVGRATVVYVLAWLNRNFWLHCIHTWYSVDPLCCPCPCCFWNQKVTGQRHMIIKCINAVWHHELVGKWTGRSFYCTRLAVHHLWVCCACTVVCVACMSLKRCPLLQCLHSSQSLQCRQNFRIHGIWAWLGLHFDRVHCVFYTIFIIC